MSTPAVPGTYVPDTPTPFGREPAVLLQLLSGLIMFGSSSVLVLDTVQQGAVNTVVAAIIALVTAIKIKGNTWAAAIIGLASALISAALAFKFELSPDAQSGIMSIVTLATGYAIRHVATPPQIQPPAGSSAVA